MGFEQVAIVGVIICATIALLGFFNTMRMTRQLGKRAPQRGRRRLLGTPEGARCAAVSIVAEIVRNHGPSVEETRKGGPAGEELIQAIEEAKAYYLGRVEARYKSVFHDVVDELVFAKTGSTEDAC
jgi:hypothetical protein